MFRILTLNANGIRSAGAKGLFKWLPKVDADVVCLQEVKAHEADIPDAWRFPDDLHGHFHCAQKKGYSGTALYSKKPPLRVATGIGVPEFDGEGRYVQAEFRHVTVVSVYFPSGSSGPHRQESKYRFLDAFFPHLLRLRDEATAAGREVIVCGDVNIAHREIDLKNWRSNQKNSGFLPQERAWLTRVFEDSAGSTCSAASTRGPSSTRGGATAARRGPRTSAGASTTRSPLPASPPRQGGWRFTRRSASPITHR
jgi:exodeoxyribonuclease-3